MSWNKPTKGDQQTKLRRAKRKTDRTNSKRSDHVKHILEFEHTCWVKLCRFVRTNHAFPRILPHCLPRNQLQPKNWTSSNQLPIIVILFVKIAFIYYHNHFSCLLPLITIRLSMSPPSPVMIETVVGQTLLASSSNTKLTTTFQTSNMEDDRLDLNQCLPIVLPWPFKNKLCVMSMPTAKKNQLARNQKLLLRELELHSSINHNRPSSSSIPSRIIDLSWSSSLGMPEVSVTGKRGLSSKGRSSNTTLQLSSSKRLILKTSTDSLWDPCGALNSFDGTLLMPMDCREVFLSCGMTPPSPPLTSP